MHLTGSIKQQETKQQTMDPMHPIASLQALTAPNLRACMGGCGCIGLAGEERHLESKKKGTVSHCVTLSHGLICIIGRAGKVMDPTSEQTNYLKESLRVQNPLIL